MAGCGPAELGVKMLPSRVTALPSGSARTGTEIVVSVVSPAGASVAANALGAPAYTRVTSRPTTAATTRARRPGAGMSEPNPRVRRPARHPTALLPGELVQASDGQRGVEGRAVGEDAVVEDRAGASG